MTNAQVGAYTRLLCIQHQQGHLTEEKMLSICKKRDPAIWSKFIQDKDGLFYNERMEKESLKRMEYSKKQSDRASKRWEKEKDLPDGKYAADDATAFPRECLLGNGNGIINNTPDIAVKNEETTPRANDLSRVMMLYLDRINAEPSMSCVELLKSYTEDMGGDVVCRAIEIAIDEKVTSWAYIKAILQNWTRQKVKSLDDVDKLEAERKKLKVSNQDKSSTRKTFAEIAAEMEAEGDA